MGVLTPVQKAQYRTHIFIIHNKEANLRSSTDYQNLNHKFSINPYPMPRIGDTMLQLEGSQYATALDLNMGYYTIDILTKSCDFTTIVAVFGKFRCNRVLIVLCASGDIFRSKVENILGGIKWVKAYINNILMLGKCSLSQYTYYMIVIFSMMCTAGFKFNAPKCSFGLN